MLQFPLWTMEIIYMICLVGLSIYGFNSLIMIFLYFRARNKQKRFSEDILPKQGSFEWPSVTIQIPIFNERYTIERLLKALNDLDYTAEKLQVQVLDDSTDQTYAIVSHLVERMQMQGLNIQHIHRDNRSGYKAGALTEGLKTASGEFIAIFDADFIPPPEWLKITIPYFQESSLGCLQTRWGHLNSNYDAFTRAISLGIDGHFVVEQTARAKNGLFLNFNGTAGIWRRTCIEDAGGWTIDTLTEDLDLSYRAQLKGWKIDYLPQVVVPAELPVQIEAFKKQQYRWAKGSFQTVRKLVPLLLKADLKEFVRLEGLIHITGYLVHPLMLATLLLMLPMGWFAPQFLKFFPLSMLAAFGPPLMYLVSQTETAPRFIDRLRRLPLMILVGFGLSVNNSIAVVQGLFSREIGTFVRTPKFNLLNQKGRWARSAYVMPLSRMVWVELSLAIYSMLTIYLLLPKVGLGVAPWMLVYTCAYLYIALTNIIQNLQADSYQQQVRSPASNRS
jgi:cellulose synthase/poly-beta-1,6-N-acetylglucosamine synthase-like glycosyltransferase